jgi:ribosomal protein S12 methylthiotransferase accessory factor
MGAHPSWARALLHALLEAVERDQLARALPHLWTRSAVRRRMLDRATLAEGAPRTTLLAARIERGGFEAFLFDLRPSLGVDSGSGSRSRSKDLGLPVAGALLFDLRHSPVPVAAGYACALTPDQALRGALLEAAQSRLTDIHGAREDVEAMDPEAAARLRALCEGVRPRCRARHIPSLPARGPRQAVAAVLGRIRRAGFPHVAACRLTPAGHPVQVAKVLVPGFRISELL